MIAIPIVPAAVQAFPVAIDTIQEIPQAATRESQADSISSPSEVIVGTIPLAIQGPMIVPITIKITSACKAKRTASNMPFSISVHLNPNRKAIIAAAAALDHGG